MRCSVLVSILVAWSGLAAADGGELFREMEHRLLNSPHLYMEYQLEAKGVVTAQFDGVLELRQGNWVEMSGKGHFMSDASEIGLHSNGTLMSGGRHPTVFGMETMAELNRSMVVGLTRMGLMHNAARLHSGGPPDHADAGVSEWVLTHEHRQGLPIERNGVRAIPVAFNLTVNQQPAGTATVWISEATGLPVAREQTVYFEGGDMVVEERFQIAQLGGQKTCPPCRQALAHYDYNVFVTRGAEHINVCCQGCADKVEADWDGYAAILAGLGEDPGIIDARSDDVVVTNVLDVGVCPPCQGGLCMRPENLPQR